MMIDGIFFSHGGAADLPGRSVKQVFGIISDHGRKIRGKMNTAEACEEARMRAYRQLAQKAASVGANAVLNVNITVLPVVYDRVCCEATISGDAVILGDEN
ncbi:MAG: heavy metal-binding domain-containing protein [Alphaproteobacteria bacterium]|jgi:uncharacterized protein YbjQ (UPF0145 family)|nr:heavy metal-binding domain-containing protein [Alphaproteobacteria bacterium]